MEKESQGKKLFVIGYLLFVEFMKKESQGKKLFVICYSWSSWKKKALRGKKLFVIGYSLVVLSI